MRVVLLTALILMSGCAPAAIGTLDYRTERPSLLGRRLLVVVPPAQADRRGTPDTVRVREFVPLETLGVSSYARVPVDTLVAALRASGAWASVEVSETSSAVALTSGSYRIVRQQPRQLDPSYKRATLTVPAVPQPDAYGPNVDAVLIVADAAMGFVESRTSGVGIGPVMPGTIPGTQATMTSQGDDAVVLESTLVLWDDETATVVDFGHIIGAAPIRSRLFSSAESRSPQGLAREGRRRFVAAARDVPAFGLSD